MYNFVRYQSHGPSRHSMISINRSGEIGFSSAFCYENKIFSYQYAVLFWDKDKMAIGVHFSNKEGENGSYTVKRTSKGGGARLAAKGFLKLNKIDIKAYSGRYQYKKYEEQNIGTLYVFELEKNENS